MTRKKLLLINLIFIVGLFLRLWHINFGLPHSFYADEPEIVELAIKYTYEIRSVIKNNEYYKLIPISYVYGTFPTYLFTFATMGFSKIYGILGIPLQKHFIYIFLRTLTAIFSMAIPVVAALLSYKLFRKLGGAIIVFLLLSINWKLAVHAHYVNADIIQTILLLFSFYTLFLYSKTKNDNKFTVLTGLLYGLAVGTKITSLISLPLYLYVFLKNKDYRGTFGFLFLIFIAFAISNPFSLIFATDFAFRIYTMLFKEAGMIFDSVNYFVFKYLKAILWISVLPVFVLSLYGKLKTFESNKNRHFHIFLIGHFFIYLIFFSLQSRRVDRWLLPILPIVVLYAGQGYEYLLEKLKKENLRFLVLTLLFSYIAYFPILMLFQFNRYTPKADAYLWMQNEVVPTAKTLAYTEEGLDPLNKLPYGKAIKYEVYVSENAQFFTPVDPTPYDYVILSSRPMSYHKNPIIREKYPFYVEKWDRFSQLVEENFELEKKFVLPKPSLIPLSDVFIYKKK